jgi:hypothetical protein
MISIPVREHSTVQAQRPHPATSLSGSGKGVGFMLLSRVVISAKGESQRRTRRASPFTLPQRSARIWRRKMPEC